MKQVINIYDAKTQLSKLVKKAEAGETIYIGAYGQPQVQLSPITEKPKLNIGVWEHKKIPNAYNDCELIGPDQDIIDLFEQSVNREEM